jgi:hypothetical protein
MDKDKLRATIRRQRDGFVALGTPFYAALSDELATDVDGDGPMAQVLAPFSSAPFAAAYVLRLFAGIHRLVLSGALPELAAHYPSTDGDADAEAAAVIIRRLLVDPPPEVIDALSRPPQTNEVGRSAALGSGFLAIAHELGLPLRLYEIGSSGGLNLRPEHYWFEHNGQGWGDAASPVRFVNLWDGGAPAFSPGPVIVDRRGCDRDPIDVAIPEGRLTLLSYVWPEPRERFTRLRHAVEIAEQHPITVDRAEAASWLPKQLAQEQPGTVRVVFHSVVWQYLDHATRTTILAALAAAGATARSDSPVAWLRLEPHPTTFVPAELRLTVWDGRRDQPRERLLATTGFHGGPIAWLADG